jgi:hypothetical protein
MLQSGRNRKRDKREIGNRKMENGKSIPVGSPIGQNEPPVPIGSQIQPSERIGDKNRIISMAVKRAGLAGLGKKRRE